MALQVWLPLNGNLKNQGTAKVTVTNSGNTINNNGKIGSCYLINKNNVITITENFFNTNEFTFSFWLKMASNMGNNTAWEAFMRFPAINASGGSVSTTVINWANYHNLKIYDDANHQWLWAAPGTNFNYDKWHHWSITHTKNRDGVNCKIYIDGILIGSYNNTTHPLQLASGSIQIGVGISGDCYINDFRIYDHCLSQEEVNEIAKGLVLHYKLDNNGMGNENLILTSNRVTGGGNASGITRTYMDDGSMKIVATSGNGNWSSLNFSKDSNTNVGAKLTPGDKYTISCDIKVESGTVLPTLFINSGNGYKQLQGNIILNQWIRAYYTSTWADPGTGYGNITLHLGFGGAIGTYYFKNFKLEKGNILTSWSLAPSDLGINSNQIYDSSGYGNHGTAVGNITFETNTQRYCVDTYFPSGSYIRVNNRPIQCLPKDAITVNIWTNTTTWGNPCSCTEGGGWNFENSNGIQFPVYISGVGYKVANSGIPSNNLNNSWHMITGTMDKDNIKIYIDGILKSTTINGSTNGIGYANNYLFLNAEAQGDSTTPASASRVGSLSDFRIYATALTAQQILDLYKNEVSIDNKENIYARELVEE